MELLSEYNTYAVPMDEIWIDPEFNCRDTFLPESVKTLADDIQASGLTYPVLIQPWGKNPPYRFRLIAGFRRHAACQMIRMVKIPAMVTEKDITEFEAHKLNFMENLERRDLNLLEEARGIAKLFPSGETTAGIARELGKTQTWVRRRIGALYLPLDIQLMLASGRLLQGDLDTLIPMKDDPEAARKAAHAILDARLESPNKARRVRETFRKGRYVTDKRRTKGQISKMIYRMFNLGINGFPTRVAAWCAGGVVDEELIDEMAVYAEKSAKLEESEENVSGEG